MVSLESLPPDQRAVLELVLRRGRSYDEIARLLSIDRAGVRARALAALDALGPQTGLPPERRSLIADYLLGALPPRITEEVRGHLARSPGERAWARVVAAELAPLAAAPLPEIPVAAPAPATAPPAPSAPAPSAAPAPAAAPPAASASIAAPAAPPAPRARRSSRRGGAVLLGGVAAAAIAAALALVLSGGHRARAPRPAARSSAPARAASTVAAASTTPQILAQINLNPPSGAGGKAKGIADVLRAQGRTGIAILAAGLAANSVNPPNFYAVWLYNTPTDSHLLGFVNPPVTANGQLQTTGALPADAARYHELLITLETKAHPKTPGPIVLEGTMAGL